jgi:hypothetical protein
VYGVSDVVAIVYPSGWADIIRPRSSAPPPPGLFSTTMGWPSIFSAILETALAQTSVEPPAANPTHMWIGFVGYLTSADQLGTVNSTATASTAVATNTTLVALIVSPCYELLITRKRVDS